jgi:GNAT superfamily N-acetyltransferase
MDFTLRQADEDDVLALAAFYEVIGKKDDDYFAQLFEKDCLVLLAEQDERIIAYGVLNFEPKYPLYARLGIAEIQDLNVHPDFRQQGIATAMIESFEQIAADQGDEMIGISVGLTGNYGPAQRLYCKLGYIPDGNGITADRVSVVPGQTVCADDDLCLMLLKQI